MMKIRVLKPTNQKNKKGQKRTVEELPDGVYCNFSFNDRTKTKLETIVFQEKSGAINY